MLITIASTVFFDLIFLIGTSSLKEDQQRRRTPRGGRNDVRQNATVAEPRKVFVLFNRFELLTTGTQRRLAESGIFAAIRVL